MAVTVILYLIPNPIPERFRVFTRFTFATFILALFVWQISRGKMKSVTSLVPEPSLRGMFWSGLVLIPAAALWWLTVPSAAILPPMILLLCGIAFAGMGVFVWLLRATGLVRRSSDG